MKTNEYKKSFIFILLMMTVFFNWVLPKAGTKISGIPLSIGILLFVSLTLFWIIKMINKKIYFPKVAWCVLLSQLYFVIRIIILYGSGIQFTEIVTYAIPLIVFPFIFFVIINEVDNKEKYKRIMDILVYGFFILCIYSIIQSIFGIAKTDIPGLTINLTDYQTLGENWFLQKSNGITEENAKIVATYQNGNVLGVNLLIFFPVIYEYILNKNNKFISLLSMTLFVIVELLTLSRSCWVGVAIFIFLRIVCKDNKRIKDLLYKFFILIVGIVIFLFILVKFPSITNRLLNIDIETFLQASGRTEGAIEFLNSAIQDGNILINILIGPFGLIENKGLAYEMTQLAIYKVGGIIGLILWCIPILMIYKLLKSSNYIQYSYKIAILVWFLVAIIEGAYWTPPTAINLFTMLGLALASKKISEKEDFEK